MSSILDQLRSGAGKAAFEAEKLRKTTTIRSEIRSLKNDIEDALLQAGRVAFQLHQSNAITQPQLREVCARVDALQAQIRAREREIERIQNETYQEPGAGAQYGHLCPNGHGQLPGGARFCPKCGAEGIHVPPPPVGPQCRNCGAALAPEARFCASCGAPVPDLESAPSGSPAGTACSGCGTILGPEARFCPECGTPAPEPSAGDAETHDQPSPEDVMSSTGISAPACPACGTEVVPEAVFCPECGAPIPDSSSEPETEPPAEAADNESPPVEATAEDSRACPNCGASLVPGAIFCPDCGNRLEEDTMAASASPDPEAKQESSEPESSFDEFAEPGEAWELQ